MAAAAHINHEAVEQRDIFPFFSLPRELRDIIYECDELLTKRTICLADVDLKLETSAMRTDLMLINKQFLHEFKEAKKPDCTTLVISDQLFPYVPNEGDLGFQLPTWTKKHTHIKFNTVMEQHYEAGCVLPYVTHCLRQLPLATTVDIRVDANGSDDEIPGFQDEFNKSWLNIPHLVTLKLYRYTNTASEDSESEDEDETDDYLPEVFHFQEPQELVLELSSETKRVEMVEEESASV